MIYPPLFDFFLLFQNKANNRDYKKVIVYFRTAITLAQETVSHETA